MSFEAVRRRKLKLQAKARQARFEDYRDLVEAGVTPADAAVRVGSNPSALSRQAYRHGAPDIARPLNAITLKTRRVNA